MKNFSDIKSLWQADKVGNLPQVAEIEGAMRQFSRQNKQKNLKAIVLLVCIIAILICLIAFAAIKMWTTYFGIAIFAGVAFYLLYSKVKRRNKLSDLETLPNNEFLNALEKEENQTCSGKTENQRSLFILWGIGFSFYIYEPASGSVNSLLIGYGALAVYIIAAWFFYMPFMTRRYQKNIQKTIRHINHLKAQINDNN